MKNALLRVISKWIRFRYKVYPKIIFKLYIKFKKWHENIVRKNTELTYSNPYQTGKIRSNNYEHYMQIALHHIREACEINWIRFEDQKESMKLANVIYNYISELSKANGHAPDILTKMDILRLLSLEVAFRQEHFTDDDQSHQSKLSTLRMEIQSVSEKDLKDSQLYTILKQRETMNNVTGTKQLLTKKL